MSLRVMCSGFVALLAAGFGPSTHAQAQAQWAGPVPVLGAGGSQAPAVAIHGPHGLDLVYTNPLGRLYWQWKDAQGDYLTPTDLNDVGATSGPALVANVRHPLEAFYRGANGHLWTSYWDGTWWSAPIDLGGEVLDPATPPLAMANAPHKVDVYYLNSAGQLTVSYWDGGQWWSAPGHFPIDGVRGPVAVATSGPHKVDVFYRDARGDLWTFWSDGGPWAAPVDMGFRITSNPSIAQGRRLQRLDGTSADCPPASGSLDQCQDVARLFFRNIRGELCWRDSVGHAAWHGIDSCTAVGVTEKIVAVSLSEVIFMGQHSPVVDRDIPSAVMRVYDAAP